MSLSPISKSTPLFSAALSFSKNFLNLRLGSAKCDSTLLITTLNLQDEPQGYIPIYFNGVLRGLSLSNIFVAFIVKTWETSKTPSQDFITSPKGNDPFLPGSILRKCTFSQQKGRGGNYWAKKQTKLNFWEYVGNKFW